MQELLSERWLGHPDCTGPVILLGDFNAATDSWCSHRLAERVPNMDLKFFVTAVVLQRQTGGDLAEMVATGEMDAFLSAIPPKLFRAGDPRRTRPRLSLASPRPVTCK